MRLLKAILTGLGGFILLMGVVGLLLMIGQSAVKDLSVDTVNFTDLKDGVYTGQYRNGRWTNSVEVTVAAGQMTAIEVVRDVRFPSAKIRMDTIDKILKAQSLEIDAIAGATVTMKAYIKAVENALVGAK
jgi:uncharacterized protein with FMN-binding domain